VGADGAYTGYLLTLSEPNFDGDSLCTGQELEVQVLEVLDELSAGSGDGDLS